jgi:UDPglucose 6-dehydrogenase
MIAFISISHLSICHAIATAEKGFNVVIFDFEENNSLFKNGNFFLYEPQLEYYYNKNKKRIKFTSDYSILKKCDLVFIAKDVDTNKKNESNFKNINTLVKKIIKEIPKKSTLVILSQVTPGFTERINWDLNKLFYQVETLIFGKAMSRALNPDRIIVGTKFKNLGEINKLNSEYVKYLKRFKTKIKLMNYKSAELSKLSINLFLISSISYANSMAEICEKIGANWGDIEEVLRMDDRIGQKAYIKPGLGIISGNLQRDLKNIIKFNYKKKIDSIKLFRFWEKFSKLRKNWIFNKIKNLKIRKKANILIFGIPYKENTNTLKNSISLELIQQFKEFNFILFDPKIKLKKNFKNCFQENNFDKFISLGRYLLILTPWKYIKLKNIQKKILDSKIKLIIDPYDLIHYDLKIKNKLDIIKIGK